MTAHDSNPAGRDASGRTDDAGAADAPEGIDDAPAEVDDVPEGAADAPAIEEGRYLYCVVSTDGTDTRDLEAAGVEGEPVSVVSADGLGAVVHACEGIYDSADLGRIRRWLVRHQSVVDEAGEAFGTPLPFQFDTVLRGDDAAVREWLDGRRDRLEAILESLAGHWEYRIEVVRTDPVDEERLAATDERLAELRERIDDADEGTGFLLEKQYETRLREVRENRRAETSADVRDRLAEHAREVHELERSPATTLDAGAGSDRADSDGGAERGDDGSGADDGAADGTSAETVCRLTVLAHEDAEGAIGSVLDDVAGDGLEVRFTGPWPPYTFAPELE